MSEHADQFEERDREAPEDYAGAQGGERPTPGTEKGPAISEQLDAEEERDEADDEA